MSGVAGADRVKSREDFQRFLTAYQSVISQFPGFVSMSPSGSYVSNPAKNDFGDIDLIIHIQSDKDKSTVKRQLVQFFNQMPETVIVPFSSVKHAGKRTYNAGELVSIRFHDEQLGYSAQIDNIIALDAGEAEFKKQFLNYPANIQGLILGLVKVATLETEPARLFQRMNIRAPQLQPNQEYEFNLSGNELQLRRVTYEPGSFKEKGREIVWASRNSSDLGKLLYQYDLTANFDNLLQQTKSTIKNPRSGERIKGIFASMITVKSGEEGTPKADEKLASLDKIRKTFSENLIKFSDYYNQLIEDTVNKHVTFCFGRMNPPTVGHGKLFDTMAEQKGDIRIFLSKTQDKKDNPLSYQDKLKFVKGIFPQYAKYVVDDVGLNTLFKVASYLYDQGYRSATFVAGEDRLESSSDSNMASLLSKYNGVEGKPHGFYRFEPLNFVSSGKRTADVAGVEGVSASQARFAAKEGNIEAFASATGTGRYTKEMYDAVRQGLGLDQGPNPELDGIKKLAGIKGRAK